MHTLLLALLSFAPQTVVPTAGGLAPEAEPGQRVTLLVPRGAGWRYLDDGSNQGSAWRAPGFDDSGWAEGRAQLGYGDGDEETQVSFGPNPSQKYVTTYFRGAFEVADPSAFVALELALLRDDGALVYLNGVEILRSNMGAGSAGFGALAESAVGGEDEDRFYRSYPDPALLVAGRNVLAVGVHQSAVTSSDLSFDLSLVGVRREAVVRGPYLQRGTPSGMVVRWRTNAPTASWVRYGTSPGALSSVASDPTPTTEHEVALSGLTPGTLYHYSVGTATRELEQGSLRSSPPTGSTMPFRAWVLGDCGTANSDARAVRDAYLAYTGATPTDLVLMLGDNAYNKGSDEEYQAAVFDTYPETLRTSPLWPARGNHEDHEAAYLDMFSLPTMGEAGGVASGSELYYSFDHANVHFVCLDSDSSDRSVGGAMYLWAASDLASTAQPWIIAFWHHPPYSKGSHDSDTEANLVQMRENFLPLFEAHGVDLVLCGHSHSYERSFLIDGHYGLSSTWNPATMLVDGGDGREDGGGAYTKSAGPHQGAVYCVAGSSGRAGSGSLDHPVMFHSVAVLGSVVLDVAGGRVDLVFLDDQGQVEDYFTLLHPAAAVLGTPTELEGSGAGPRRLLVDGGLENAGRPFALVAAADVERGSPPRAAPAWPLAWPRGVGGPVALGRLDDVGTAQVELCVPPALARAGLRLVLLVLGDGDPGGVSLRSNAVSLGPGS